MGLFSRLFGRSQPPAAPDPPAPDPDMVVVPIPPLLSVLVSMREQKGSELTETEVLDARDNAICMTMERSRAIAFARKRGVRDVDPENVWADWQKWLAERAGTGGHG